MGWRDFRKSTLEEKAENEEFTPSRREQIPQIPQNPPETDFKDTPLTILDHLDETSREAFREYVDLMTGPKFRMPLEQAQLEASRLVLRNLRTLQINQAAQDYQRYGYVKIFSTVLNRAIYLAQEKGAAKRVPDQDIPIFLESEIEAVKGLTSDEAKVLLEARILFGGLVRVEDHSEALSKRKVNGKKIARNFYGKGNDGKTKTAK